MYIRCAPLHALFSAENTALDCMGTRKSVFPIAYPSKIESNTYVLIYNVHVKAKEKDEN